MNVKKIPVGYLEANCYILKKGKFALIIDPGDEQEKIEQELTDAKVVGILITHSHFDHVGALSYFENKYHIKHNEKSNLFFYEEIDTPGHAKDAKTFYFPEEKIMFTGDFLFKNSIGRMDLPGGNVEEMKKSLEKILNYAEDITIYPGHGEISNLKNEKENILYYLKKI